jgi:hypothetical protein
MEKLVIFEQPQYDVEEDQFYERKKRGKRKRKIVVRKRKYKIETQGLTNIVLGSLNTKGPRQEVKLARRKRSKLARGQNFQSS